METANNNANNLGLRLAELRKDFTKNELEIFCMSICPIELLDSQNGYGKYVELVWKIYLNKKENKDAL